MEQSAVFGPLLALIGWTLLVLLVIPYRRFKAVSNRQIKPQDFKLGESENVPPYVRIPNRNWMNLLEAPLLFYVICFVLFLSRNVDTSILVLAWCYVGCRVVHSLIHLTCNKVLYRLVAFALSNGILSALWVMAVCAFLR